MKSIRNIAFSALLTFGAFSAITYTACNKDECKDVVCQNGGTCSEGNCTCPTGFEGTNCETLSRDKMLGTYLGTEVCDLGTDNYSITLSANSDKIKITLINLYNDAITAVCTMTGANTFTFNGTQSGATFTGTGTYASSTLTVEYTLTDGAIANSCTFTGSK